MTTNPSGPTTAEGMPITRRAVLAGATATATLAASTAATLAAIPSWMELRIEVHRDAAKEAHRLGLELDALDATLDDSFGRSPVWAKLKDERGKRVEIDVSYDSGGAEDEIAAIFCRATTQRLNVWARDDDAAAMQAAIHENIAQRDRNRDALRSAEKERQERRGAVGIEEAGAAFDQAAAREDAALAALLAERPRTLADAEARARYLLSAPAVFDRSREHVDALLASMTGGEA